jgi:hypothetical protein
VIYRVATLAVIYDSSVKGTHLFWSDLRDDAYASDSEQTAREAARVFARRTGEVTAVFGMSNRPTYVSAAPWRDHPIAYQRSIFSPDGPGRRPLPPVTSWEQLALAV